MDGFRCSVICVSRVVWTVVTADGGGDTIKPSPTHRITITHQRDLVCSQEAPRETREPAAGADVLVCRAVNVSEPRTMRGNGAVATRLERDSSFSATHNTVQSINHYTNIHTTYSHITFYILYHTRRTRSEVSRSRHYSTVSRIPTSCVYVESSRLDTL